MFKMNANPTLENRVGFAYASLCESKLGLLNFRCARDIASLTILFEYAKILSVTPCQEPLHIELLLRLEA
jgi:hypothetical protein